MEPRLLQHLRALLTASAQKLTKGLRVPGLEELGRLRTHVLSNLRRATRLFRYPVHKAMPRIQPVTGIVLIFCSIAAVGGYFAINEYAAVGCLGSMEIVLLL